MQAKNDFSVLHKYSELNFMVGNLHTVEMMSTISPLQIFSEEIILFFNDLSKKLMRVGKEYSDVVTFGFWCRRASLLIEKSKYDVKLRYGRGTVFHSTPSNVPVNFAFSFASGLLAGNANIVRLPAKKFEQVEIICNVINELLVDKHKGLIPYICMVKYPPNVEITDVFSLTCDSRVIWGGDDTISEIRKSSLKPRANEITFADRYSIAILNADEYLKAENKDKITQDFYNDTYFSDQNACTAPRIVIWIGGKINKAKEIFWYKIHELAKEQYNLTPVQSVGKLSALYRVASQLNVSLINNKDQFVTRVTVEELSKDLLDYRYNSGFFFEYDAVLLSEILPLCGERCQTLTYFGISNEELENFVNDYPPKGIDRMVPLGKSMEFSLVWDGYDLIINLSRKVCII